MPSINANTMQYNLSHAYEQICFNDESKKYTTKNTHNVLFCYTIDSAIEDHRHCSLVES